jgi:hypothetical protein
VLRWLRTYQLQLRWWASLSRERRAFLRYERASPDEKLRHLGLYRSLWRTLPSIRRGRFCGVLVWGKCPGLRLGSVDMANQNNEMHRPLCILGKSEEKRKNLSGYWSGSQSLKQIRELFPSGSIPSNCTKPFHNKAKIILPSTNSDRQKQKFQPSKHLLYSKLI